MLQDIEGREAIIIGTKYTDNFYGVNEDMFDYIDCACEIEKVLIGILGDDENVVMTEDHPKFKARKDEHTIIGVEMFGYSWHIKDIQILPIKEKIKRKTMRFNPANLMKAENRKVSKRVCVIPVMNVLSDLAASKSVRTE